MGWALGWDPTWERDIGYGVPATCDHPACEAKIDRGLSHVCGGEPYGGDQGCGLCFCYKHLQHSEDLRYGGLCDRCASGEPPFEPTPDVPEWVRHKLRDPSWAAWRAENPEWVRELESRCTVSAEPVAESEVAP